LATAQALWDKDGLFLGFEVADRDLQSHFGKRDEHLWEEDCVEILIDPQGKGRDYYEIQVSPAGILFDTKFDGIRRPAPFGHTDWKPDLVARVTRQGTLNDQIADQGYTVELEIPWTALNAGAPSNGTAWRINFFVLDRHGKDQTAATWSPPRVNDFHVPD